MIALADRSVREAGAECRSGRHGVSFIPGYLLMVGRATAPTMADRTASADPVARMSAATCGEGVARLAPDIASLIRVTNEPGYLLR